MSRQRKTFSRKVLEDWWEAAREEAEQGVEHSEELARRFEELGDQLADYHLLDAERRKRLAAMARAIRAFVRRSGAALPRTESIEARPGRGAYGIELSAFEAGPCVGCGDPVAAGPVGRAREPEPGPLCDSCLGERCPPLGAVLMQILSLREIGEFECETAEQQTVLILMLISLGKLTQGGSRRWRSGR